MTTVEVTNEVRSRLKKSGFTEPFLDNCINSQFLSIAEDNSKIVGACFVGGLFHSNGIEIIKEYRGKGLSKKMLNEVLAECKKRKLSYLMGVFKPTNQISIKTHTDVGYIPVFSLSYNKTEGREIVVILPLNSKGRVLMNLLKIFNTKIGNIFFALAFKISSPFLKSLIAFSGEAISKLDLCYSVKNFEKLQPTPNDIDNKVDLRLK